MSGQLNPSPILAEHFRALRQTSGHLSLSTIAEQVLLPLTMLLLLGSTLWTWAPQSGSGGWMVFDRVVNITLGVIGAVFTLMFPAIAAYGFYHRRRLVGNLVVDALPGS